MTYSDYNGDHTTEGHCKDCKYRIAELFFHHHYNFKWFLQMGKAIGKRSVQVKHLSTSALINS